MTLLLDSHVLLWALHVPEKLRTEVRQMIEDPANSVFYSAGTVWELELKVAKGKLSLPDNWVGAVAEVGFKELPVSGLDGAASARLPWHHSDPFDRLFIAQAIARRWKFVSRDSQAALYKVDLLIA